MIGYFLPIIVVLGILASVEDYTTTKIRNKHLLLGLILGLVVYLILIFLKGLDWKDFAWVLVSAGFALIIGFVMWYVNWWGPGDAKLYAVFVLLTPISLYKYSTTQFPGLEILINGIMPLALYLTVNMFVTTSKTEKLLAAKYAGSPKRVGTSAVALFAITWGTQYLYPILGIKSNIIINL
ncbi:prepilin peptidase, partial [Nanoarchaeota archaeon]